MRGRYGRANQRRLNTAIARVFGDRYRDWFEYVVELHKEGLDYAETIQRIAALGVTISVPTLCDWIKQRERLEERRHSSTAEAAG